MDDCEAAAEMTRHLLELGHRRIGFIKGHLNHIASHDRYRGFAMALREYGLNPNDAPVEQGYFTYRSGLVATERLLARATGITAIFASNDDMASAAVSVAHRRGLSVPDDLSIVGFDDTSLATSVWPELTTIKQPIAAMAEAAMELLLADLRDRRAGARRSAPERVLDHELIVRESSAPLVAALKRNSKAPARTAKSA
jgi:LacI family transcriptional regulator